jgi:hypothetical protein
MKNPEVSFDLKYLIGTSSKKILSGYVPRQASVYQTIEGFDKMLNLKSFPLQMIYLHPSHLSQVSEKLFRNTLVMGFAYTAVSAAQKPRHPFGDEAFSIPIPGILPVPSAAKAPLFRRVARLVSGKNPLTCSPEEPLSREKTNGAGGVMAGLDPAISAGLLSGFKGCIQNVFQPKAVL